LEHLSTIGVGYKSVAATVGCSHTTLAKIINGTRHRVRAHLAARVLEVDRSAVADHALVPAGPTWKLLDELIAAGYTKRWLAEQLGYKAKLKRDWVWAINASRVERLYRRLQDGRISR
jgi:DNA-binding CsgD family transcriptional regulator